MLFAHGTAEQTGRFVNAMTLGNQTFAQMLSEPDAGSDLAGVRARAERDGDEWVVNGSKIWTSNAAISRVIPDMAVGEFQDRLRRQATTSAQGRGIGTLLNDLVARFDRAGDPLVRQTLAQLHTTRRTMTLTNQRVKANWRPGSTGPSAAAPAPGMRRLDRARPRRHRAWSGWIEADRLGPDPGPTGAGPRRPGPLRDAPGPRCSVRDLPVLRSPLPVSVDRRRHR